MIAILKIIKKLYSINMIKYKVRMILIMIDSQLDGNVTAKELSESFKELVEEFERIEKRIRIQIQKINSVLSTQIKRKRCCFYTLFNYLLKYQNHKS